MLSWQKNCLANPLLIHSCIMSVKGVMKKIKRKKQHKLEYYQTIRVLFLQYCSFFLNFKSSCQILLLQFPILFPLFLTNTYYCFQSEGASPFVLFMCIPVHLAPLPPTALLSAVDSPAHFLIHNAILFSLTLTVPVLV